MERKKFFLSIGAGFLGFAVFKSIPFSNLLSKKKEDEKVTIAPNPLAVRRKKIGEKNV